MLTYKIWGSLLVFSWWSCFHFIDRWLVTNKDIVHSPCIIKVLVGFPKRGRGSREEIKLHWHKTRSWLECLHFWNEMFLSSVNLKPCFHVWVLKQLRDYTFSVRSLPSLRCGHPWLLACSLLWKNLALAAPWQLAQTFWGPELRTMEPGPQTKPGLVPTASLQLRVIRLDPMATLQFLFRPQTL